MIQAKLVLIKLHFFNGQHPLTPSSFLNLSSSSVNASSSTWLQAGLDAIKIARDTLTAAQARQA